MEASVMSVVRTSPIRWLAMRTAGRRRDGRRRLRPADLAHPPVAQELDSPCQSGVGDPSRWADTIGAGRGPPTPARLVWCGRTDVGAQQLGHPPQATSPLFVEADGEGVGGGLGAQGPVAWDPPAQHRIRRDPRATPTLIINP